MKLDAQTYLELKKRQKQSRDKRVYMRVTALLMLNAGHTPQQVAELLGIDDGTVYRYKNHYESEGLASYLENHHADYKGKLTEEECMLLKTEVSTTFYQCSNEVRLYIKETFGKEYAKSAVTKLLGRLGFVYKKTRQDVIGDVAQQLEFVEKLKELSSDPNNEVYFTDAVHPQHNTKSEYGWALKGESFSIPPNTGRSRVNINGALNANDVTDVQYVESQTINGETMVELARKLVKKHGNDKKIIVVCDNARYNRCRLVTDWLKENPNVEFHYLPPYSPNLNLIERYWKFLKKKVINSYYYKQFDDFKKAVLTFLDDPARYEDELKSLLTLNFHIREYPMCSQSN